MHHHIRRGLGAAALGLALSTTALAKAPNIVFILTDDLDTAAAAQMTQVRSLITNPGTNFRRHYVSLSLCCPSRVTGLRGQFAHNTTIFTKDFKTGYVSLKGVYGVDPTIDQMPCSFSSVNQVPKH